MGQAERRSTELLLETVLGKAENQADGKTQSGGGVGGEDGEGSEGEISLSVISSL